MGMLATISAIDDDGAAALSIGGADEAKGLLTVIQRLSRARSQDEIMVIVGHAVRTLLRADGATFVLREGDRCYYAQEDAISPLWRGRRFPINDCISGWCMLNDQAVVVPDISQEPRVPPDAYRPTFVRSLAMAPVRLDEPVAALGAYWSERHQPCAEEMGRLQAIADAAALAVAHVQQRHAGRAGQPAPLARAPQPLLALPLVWARDFASRLRSNGLQAGKLEAFAFAVLCVAIATLVRLTVKAIGVQGAVVYSTYYPAALLATLYGGRWAGVLAAALGGGAYWLLRAPAGGSMPFTASDAINLALYAASCGLIVLIIDSYKRAVVRLREEDARHLTLAREQHHRARNAASVVEAIVKLSLRDEPERAGVINRRIRAALAGINMKDPAAGQPVGLRDLLAAELQPYDLARFVLEGPADAPLPPEARSVLALAVHELATNALKYGSLSVPDGRVTVTWRQCDGCLAVGWRESGGPPVEPPTKRGYGSIMLRRLVEAAGGTLTVEFNPAGLTAEISLSLEPGGSCRAEKVAPAADPAAARA